MQLDENTVSKSSLVTYVEAFLASLLTLGSIAWATGMASVLGLSLYDEQFGAMMLAVALALAFVHMPFHRGQPRGPVPWYDWLAGVAAFVATAYLAIQYSQLVDLVVLRPLDAVIAGCVIITLLLEALRRSTGNVLPILVIGFLIYALFAKFVPGQLQGRSTDWQKLSAYLTIDVNGMLGIPLKIGTTVVVTFIFFGNLLMVTGASNWFTELALTAMGRFRGGSAKIAVLASALFGSISGSAVANVVATGVVTIPMIKRSGYKPHQAAAIEAVASTGGQLMPPVMGASAFLMAEFLQISYAEVVLAALIPAIFYFLAIFIQTDLDAAKQGIVRVPEEEIPKLRSVVPGFYFILPFALLIVFLFVYNDSPELSALWAALLLVSLSLIFGYKGVRPSLNGLLKTFKTTGISVIEIVLITASAGLVIGVLAITGLGFNLTLALVTLGGGHLYLLLILSALLCVVLGMGLPTVGVYVLLATLVAPALVEVGVMPIAAHLFVMYFGMMSMITPPVAIAAYAAAGLANADPLKTGFESVRLGWSAYVVPFLFVLSPTLILQGELGDVTIAVLTAAIGIWLVSIAMVGYFLRPISGLIRLLFILSGLLSLVPANSFNGAQFTDIMGFGMGVVLIGREVLIHRAIKNT